MRKHFSYYILAVIVPIFIVFSYYRFTDTNRIYRERQRSDGLKNIMQMENNVGNQNIGTTFKFFRLIHPTKNKTGTTNKEKAATPNVSTGSTTKSSTRTNKSTSNTSTSFKPTSANKSAILTSKTTTKVVLTRSTTTLPKPTTTAEKIYNDSSFSVINENMTIVTAYFNLGSFQKGYGKTFTADLYFGWTKPFAYILNPLVVFTDSEVFEKLMTKHREKLKLKTKIFLIQRDTMWSFQLINEIKNVYSQSGYPKHHPNTVIPAYSCAQHAKYEAVAETVRRKLFNTEFYAWLDIGYFRDIVSDKSYFRLDPPSYIDRSRLAMNRVYGGTTHIKPDNIMKNNIVWVGGGMFIGTGELILKFEKLYKKAVKYFIDHNIMNTDQQVIYSLYSDEGRKALQPDVELQLFVPKGNGNPWFYLGYLCRHVIKLGGSNSTALLKL